MRVERFWGQPYGWFATLDHSAQVAVMADYNVEHRQPPSKKSNPQARRGRR